MKVRVDLSGASEAVGEHTTYYAGKVQVGVLYTEIDGMTDRSSYSWNDAVVEQLAVAFGVPYEEYSLDGNPDDAGIQISDRMSLGSIYDVSEDGTIEEVLPDGLSLELFHVDDVEHGLMIAFYGAVTLPVTNYGKDSGVVVYVGQTKLGRLAVGPVDDDFIKSIAARIVLKGE